MLLSVIVYTLTFLTMFAFALCLKNDKVAVVNNIKVFKRWDILMVLVFVLVFGLRYDVGIDYESYKITYELQRIDGLEYLFKFTTKLLYDSGFHSAFYFGLWVWFQIFFLIKSFKDEKYIYPSLIFTLFSGQYFLLWMNVIRQDIAACIFIYSITFIVSKNLVKYLLCIVLALGFHKSALLLLFFYPLFQFKKNLFSDKYLQLAFLFMSLIIGFRFNAISFVIDNWLDPYLSYLRFDEVYTKGGIERNIRDVTIGISFITSLFIDIIIIFYSKKMKSFYNNERVLCFYDLYFAGTCINYILIYSFLLLRPFRYLRFFKMIISAYLLYYLFQNRKEGVNYLIFVLFIVLYLIMYVAIFGSSFYPSKYMYQIVNF